MNEADGHGVDILTHEELPQPMPGNALDTIERTSNLPSDGRSDVCVF